MKSLIQFVVSQASTELKHWTWRAEKKIIDEMGEDEEMEVIEERDDPVKEEL